MNKLSFEYGETAEIRLSDSLTGDKHKWNFEIYTENGWQEVCGTDEDVPLDYTDEAVDGSHAWDIELTE